MSSVSVSVIVTAHNYAEYLEKCLDSALAQTLSDEKYEVVVVDDGSTDETPEMLKEYRFENPDMIRIVRLEGEGLPTACNAGINAAEGEYIIRLDADDYFDENILSIELDYLESHPETALVYPDYYTINDDDEIIDQARNPKVEEEVKLLNRSPLAAGALYRRSAWEALGGYDESLDYQEDYDFWIRFINEFDVHNINLPLMYYRRHGENMSNNLSGRLNARNNVKAKFVEENLSSSLEEKEVLCIVPARAEQRIDGDENESPLALRGLNGRPLIDYTIREVIAADRIDRVVVSTENEAIAQRTKDLGADVPFLRPSELSGNTVPLEEVTSNLLGRLRETEDYEPDLVMIKQYISPLITAKHIDGAIDTWHMFSVDSVISVTETNKFYWQPGKFGLSPLFEERLLREDRETLYQENGAFYVFTPSVLNHQHNIIGEHVGHLQVERQDAVHIDSWFDFKLCEQLLSMNDGELTPSYQSVDQEFQ